MNDLDRKIQTALSRDNSNAPIAGDANLAEEVLAAFRGRHRWLSAMVITAQIAAVLGLVFTTVRFYQAPDVTSQLRWGGLGIALLLVVSLIKIWFWLELQSNRVLREVKRMELLLISRPPA